MSTTVTMMDETQSSVQDPPSATSQPAAWDTPEYEAALATLDRLQEQMDKLRSTIPAIVAPLAASSSSGKAHMAAQVRKAAAQSTADLKTFREQWTSDQTRELFARSQASELKDGDLSRARVVAR